MRNERLALLRECQYEVEQGMRSMPVTQDSRFVYTALRSIRLLLRAEIEREEKES